MDVQKGGKTMMKARRMYYSGGMLWWACNGQQVAVSGYVRSSPAGNTFVPYKTFSDLEPFPVELVAAPPWKVCPACGQHRPHRTKEDSRESRP
jgi:hypothetical protein